MIGLIMTAQTPKSRAWGARPTLKLRRRASAGHTMPALLLSILVIGLLPGRASGEPLFGAVAYYATGSRSGNVAIGDLNLDGAPDLVTVNMDSSTVSVLMGDGSGAFRPRREYATGTGPTAVLVGDTNQDGILDVLTLGATAVSVLLGNGDGSFGGATDFETGLSHGTPSFATADLNADSKLDVVVAGFGIVSVFLGNGDGTFGARRDVSSGGTAWSVAVGDLNGDSKPDIAFPQGGQVNTLLGNGDGTFRSGGGASVQYPGGGDPNIIAIGDFNGDNTLDLVMTVMGPSVVSLLLGNGDGSFSGQTDYGRWSRYYGSVLAKGDYNGDGRLDLATALIGGPAIAVLLGIGDGLLEEQPEQYPMQGRPGLATTGDLNGDSRLDLVVSIQGWAVVFKNIRNRAPAASAHGPYVGLTTHGIDFSGTASSDPDGDALAYAWDFGDGSTASGPTPRHAYASEGVFPVVLRVTDPGSLSDADSTSATVRSDVPVAIILKSNGTVLDAKTGKGYTKVAIEQTMMPYSSIIASTLRLRTDYPTPGAVTECEAEAKAGTATIGDLDLNTVPDYLVTFAESCVRDLFSGAPNNTTANITVTGEVETTSGAAPLRGVKSVTVRTSPGGAGPIFAWASPNPFNPETAISYSVKGTGPVTLRIYSIDGRLVRTLKLGEITAAGTHELRWDGTDDNNQHVSSGIYFLKTNQMLGSTEASAVLKLAVAK